MSRPIPDLLARIRALVALPTVSCTDPRYDQSNLPVIHLLAEWLEAVGFRAEIMPVGDGKANLVASLGGPADQPGGLVLSGHTDTVPCNPELWTSDPFRATERDGRIYGLGSCDMKGFFSLAIEAALRYEAKAYQRPLVILATADEESSMSGARALLAENRRLGRQAVIGEPTGLKPIRLHKGVMMEAITVKGRAGHSSDPALGANALDGMHAVISELLAFRAELKAKHRHPAFKVDYPTLNLGSIHGGDNPNRICGCCETQIDIRPLPGMDLEELHQVLANRLAPVLAGYPGLSLELRRLFAGLPPFETPAGAGIVRACEAFTGQGAGSVAFGTEAPFLSQLGMDTVVMGPGSIDQAHQPDEYLPLDHIAPGVEMLGRLIERFCLNPAA
ncbi:acetylornithine deacetylase [Methylomagnum ishizawai]|uniref:Acetylornithine deacetylase n=1 Tax=Methylomagnum ishizawai TaxID=1760988 RepID=A0A1Y6DAV8_9GAMM|nr:acetylornithine deacetylase [Methylomagnum ishizawai]SMF96785.1 acetylornithine deacetylase [Methylomagnum ishizawai]